VNDFFYSMVRGTFEERLRTGVKRNDFIQLLLQLREKGSVDIDPREEDDEDDEALTHSSAPVESISQFDAFMAFMESQIFIMNYPFTLSEVSTLLAG
jgi:hypothetical protein